jgi:ABC-type polysaccharide/polyol phosphate export permease
VYDENIVPQRYKFAYSLNPVTRLIDSTRGVFLQQQLPSPLDVTIIASSIVVFFLLGGAIFRAFESRFAEDL